MTPGIVFNLSQDLRGLDSSPDGVSVKLAFGASALRLRASAEWASASGAFSAGGGLTYEYHFAWGTVSPYVGAFADAQYVWDGVSVPVLPASAGAVAGIEIFPFPFLSIFAEYEAAVDLTVTPSQVTGTAALKLGNASRVGVVVYLGHPGATP